MTIPTKAVGSSYGNEMEQPFAMDFVTVPSNPVVVLSYPGDDIENVDVDSQLKVKFSQEIFEGSDFEDISLYSSNKKEISADLMLNEEWLYVNPEGNLDKNTQYTLFIPSWAVKNNRNELLHEDYEVTFKTGEQSSKNYDITRQIQSDGSIIVLVDLIKKSVKGLNIQDDSVAVIDLTKEVTENETIQLNLDASAVKWLLSEQTGLKAITRKGEILFSVVLIKYLSEDRGGPINVILDRYAGYGK